MKSKYYCHICGIVSGFQTYTTCFLELKSMHGFKLEFTHVKKEAQHIWIEYSQPDAFYGTAIVEEAEKLMQLLEDFKSTGEIYELLDDNRPWYKFRVGAFFWKKIKRVWDNFRKGKNVG